MLKTLHAWLQHYANQNLDVQAELRKGTRDQIPNIHWITEKAREFQGKKQTNKQTKKHTSICFIDYEKTFDYVDHN